MNIAPCIKFGWISVLWIIFWFNIYSVFGIQPDFIEQPADAVARLGDDVTLKCTLRWKNGSCRWKKNGGIFKIIANSRFQLLNFSHETEVKNCSFIIRGVTRDDFGIYQCTSYGSSDKHVTLVSREAKISDVSELQFKNTTGYRNGNITLRCIFNQLHGKCIWKRNTTELKVGERVLLLGNVSKSSNMTNCTIKLLNLTEMDAGVYECALMFSRQGNKSHERKLSRQVAWISVENPEMLQEPADFLVNVGDDLTLRCVVQLRNGSCSWKKNGKVLKIDVSNSRLQLPNNDHNSEVTNCSLIMRGIQVDDLGTYQCLSIIPSASASYKSPVSREAKISGASEEILQNAVGYRNQKMTLKCVFDKKIGKCSWKRNTIELQFGERIRFIGNLSESRNMTNCSIKLENVTDADTGIYECFLTSLSGGNKSSDHTTDRQVAWISIGNLPSSSQVPDHSSLGLTFGIITGVLLLTLIITVAGFQIYYIKKRGLLPGSTSVMLSKKGTNNESSKTLNGRTDADVESVNVVYAECHPLNNKYENVDAQGYLLPNPDTNHDKGAFSPGNRGAEQLKKDSPKYHYYYKIRFPDQTSAEFKVYNNANLPETP